MREFGLYLHIPFCIRKCSYCDFLSAPADETVRREYVDMLCHEIAVKAADHRDKRVSSVFIGGGTPSCLEIGQIKRIMRQVRDCFDVSEEAEITIEANPGTVSEDKLKEYKSAGINRISFGLQSTNDEELKLLGRIHDFESFKESYALARSAGFDNINVDLISAIPGQNAASWSRTLSSVIALKPEHISAYSLIIEEGTPFYNIYGQGGMSQKERTEHGYKELPSEDEERLIYHDTLKLLADSGYHRYEISNYAKDGYESRHNTLYWRRGEYLGLGLGASSFINEERWKNTSVLSEYLKPEGVQLREEVEKLNQRDAMAEFMFLGLRMMEGVSEEEFFRCFDVSIYEIFGKIIRKHEDHGLIERLDGKMWLTARGIDVSNYVFSDYLE